MGIMQGVRTLCRYDFEISTWYRIFFVEVAFYVNALFRVVILFNEPKQFQPPYWRFVVSAFIAILGVFFPIKLCCIAGGVAYKNARLLKIYSLINWTITPLAIPLIVYLRWSQWWSQPALFDTIVEIGVFIIFVGVGAWGIFWAVPRLLRRLDFTFLKRLEKYVVLQPLEILAEGTSPVKLEYERYYRRSSDCSVSSKGKKENTIPPDSFKNCFISPLNVSIDKNDIIGEGQFGKVYKSCLLRHGESLMVVAKSAKHDDIHSIVHEVVISIYVGQHPNIVHFLGVTSDSYTGNYYLLSEYCEGGSLLNYLEKLRPYKSTQYVNINGTVGVQKINQLLARFTREILQGMTYLASKRVVHGDLSARNIVLTSDLNIKICDFGMSNKLYSYQLYSKQLQQDVLPWRWLPVEVLEDLKFSEKSDVYAFGVTLYELYSLGTLPHGSISWDLDILKMLRNGELKLECPSLADDFTYSLMKCCWQVDSALRPSFVQLQESFNAPKFEKSKMIIDII